MSSAVISRSPVLMLPCLDGVPGGDGLGQVGVRQVRVETDLAEPGDERGPVLPQRGVVGDDRRAEAVAVGQPVDVQPVPFAQEVEELVDPQRAGVEAVPGCPRPSRDSCSSTSSSRLSSVNRRCAAPGLGDHRARPVLEQQRVQALGQVLAVELDPVVGDHLDVGGELVRAELQQLRVGRDRRPRRVRASSIALSRPAAYLQPFLRGTWGRAAPAGRLPGRSRPGGRGSWPRFTRCCAEVVQLLHGERGPDEAGYAAEPRGGAPLGEPGGAASPAGR